MPRKQVMVWNSLLREILTVGDWWMGIRGDIYIHTHTHIQLFDANLKFYNSIINPYFLIHF